VTDILDRLEEKGLVIRQRSSFDKRRVYIQITDKGKAIVLKKPSLLKEDFTRQFDELEEWEQTLILSSIQRIVTMMKTPEMSNVNSVTEKKLVV
jgi:DNA-binding MarR family transcriptional regulator